MTHSFQAHKQGAASGGSRRAFRVCVCNGIVHAISGWMTDNSYVLHALLGPHCRGVTQTLLVQLPMETDPHVTVELEGYLDKAVSFVLSFQY